MTSTVGRLAATLAMVSLAACQAGGAPGLPPTSPGKGGKATPSAITSDKPAREPGDQATPAPSGLVPVSPSGDGATPAPAPTRAVVLAGKVSAPSTLVLAAGGLISDKGIGVVSNNGSALIANNGSNIIANNGSGLIANNGGSLTGKTKYGLRALGEVPLEGAIVTLVDGAGQPLLGADGQPVRAVTDAEGRYAFAGVRPGRHLVVRAELPKVGALSRIVAPQVADAPVDFASTLASTYVLRSYVASQADKQATLDRLPPEVEAETVAIAAKAAASDTPPETLEAGGLVARVDALRAKDPTLDAQLEKVKQLLIVGGASNLGAGEKATEVTLRRFQTIWPLADGRVYLQVGEDGMIWRLDLDGRLRAVVGRAAEGPGKDVTVGEAPLTVDARGRLLFGGEGGDRLWRVTPGATPADMKVEDLTGGLVDVIAACPLEGDDVLAFTWTPQKPAKVWRITPGTPPKELASETGTPPTLGSVRRAVRMADGTIRVEVAPFIVPALATFDMSSGALTVIKRWSQGMRGLRLGIDGELYYGVDGEPGARRWTGGADDPKVPDLLDADLQLYGAFALSPAGVYHMGGGFALSTRNATLGLRKGGVSTHVAGLTAEASASGPGVVSLTQPTAFAIEADGDLLVVDNGVLVRVTPGGTPVPVLSAALAAGGESFVPAIPFVTPGGAVLLVAREKSDSFLDQDDAVFRLGADGAASLVFRARGSVFDVVQAGDGTIFTSATENEGFQFSGEVARITPEGEATVLQASAKEYGNAKIWLDAGRLVIARRNYAAGKTTLLPRRYEPDGTTVDLPERDAPPPFTDAKGRTYALGSTITRTDPVTGVAVVLAGQGGRAFAGTGVDDGVGKAKSPLFAPNGDLYFIDEPNRQIKRVPADQLEP